MDSPGLGCFEARTAMHDAHVGHQGELHRCQVNSYPLGYFEEERNNLQEPLAIS